MPGVGTALRDHLLGKGTDGCVVGNVRGKRLALHPPRIYPTDVDVEHNAAYTVGEACNGGRCISADTRKGSKLFDGRWYGAVVLVNDDTSCIAQPESPAVVAKPLPCSDHRAVGGPGQMTDGGELGKEQR